MHDCQKSKYSTTTDKKAELMHTIKPLKDTEVLNILQTSFICNTCQAVRQATGFKLENHRYKPTIHNNTTISHQCSVLVH